MKTEVKFRDLPEKVQDFLERTRSSDKELVGSDDVRLSWIHNLPEWKDATDEERLAYAEWRYPVGTKCKSAYELQTIKFGTCYGNIHLDLDCIWCSVIEHDNCLVLYDDERKKWAEIVTEPDKKPLFKEASAQEPKAGDMVEVSEDKINWQKGWIYRGIKTSYGWYICENQVETEIGDFVSIRLPQKSDVESKAKEILKTWIDFGNDAGTIEVVTNAIKSGIKWGQANPGKI